MLSWRKIQFRFCSTLLINQKSTLTENSKSDTIPKSETELNLDLWNGSPKSKFPIPITINSHSPRWNWCPHCSLAQDLSPLSATTSRQIEQETEPPYDLPPQPPPSPPPTPSLSSTATSSSLPRPIETPKSNPNAPNSDARGSIRLSASIKRAKMEEVSGETQPSVTIHDHEGTPNDVVGMKAETKRRVSRQRWCSGKFDGQIKIPNLSFSSSSLLFSFSLSLARSLSSFSISVLGYSHRPIRGGWTLGVTTAVLIPLING